MSERDNFVAIKFPLYRVEAKEVDVDGNLRQVQPFVEQWKIFDIVNQKFLSFRNMKGHIYLGLRIPGEEDRIHCGANSTPDPIRLFRALQIISRFERFSLTKGAQPHSDLHDTYDAAGHSFPLQRHHYVRDKISSIIGEQSLEEVLQMVPANLVAVINNLHKQKIKINGETLAREVRRGTVEMNPLYENVLRNTRKRAIQDKRFREKFWRTGLR